MTIKQSLLQPPVVFYQWTPTTSSLPDEFLLVMAYIQVIAPHEDPLETLLDAHMSYSAPTRQHTFIHPAMWEGYQWSVAKVTLKGHQWVPLPEESFTVTHWTNLAPPDTHQRISKVQKQINQVKDL